MSNVWSKVVDHHMKPTIRWSDATFNKISIWYTEKGPEIIQKWICRNDYNNSNSNSKNIKTSSFYFLKVFKYSWLKTKFSHNFWNRIYIIMLPMWPRVNPPKNWGFFLDEMIPVRIPVLLPVATFNHMLRAPPSEPQSGWAKQTSWIPRSF